MKKSVKVIAGYALSAVLTVTNISMTMLTPSGFGTGVVYAAEDGNFTYKAGDSSYNCEVLADGTVSVLAYEGTESILVIPDEIDGRAVTAIEQCAFMENEDISEVVIPATINTIGGYAFAKCSGLQRVVIQAGQVGIGRRAFYDCAGLQDIIFTDSVPKAGLLGVSGSSEMTVYYNPEKGDWQEYIEFNSDVQWLEYHGVYELSGRLALTVEDVTVKYFLSESQHNLLLNAAKLTEEDSSYQRMEEVLEKQGFHLSDIKSMLYDINLSDAEGNIVKSETGVELQIALPKELRGQEYRLYRLNEKGELELLQMIDITKQQVPEEESTGETESGQEAESSEGDSTDETESSDVIGDEDSEDSEGADVTDEADTTDNQAEAESVESESAGKSFNSSYMSGSKSSGYDEAEQYDRFICQLEELGTFVITVNQILPAYELSEDDLKDNKTFYTAAGGINDANPLVRANSMAETQWQGVYSRQIELPAYDETDEQSNVFQLYKIDSDTVEDGGRSAQLCLATEQFGANQTVFRVENEEAVIAELYYDSSTGAVILLDEEQNPVPYHFSWVGDRESRQFTTVEEFAVCGYEWQAEHLLTQDIPNIALAVSELYEKITGKTMEFDKEKYAGQEYQYTSGDAVYTYQIQDIDSVIITAYKGSETEVTVPDKINGIQVEEIGERAFYECADITSIVLPEGIVKVGNAAFSGCSKLEKVDMPDSVESIGGFAFKGCGDLKEMILPEGIRSIEGSTFSGCSSLEKINIPDTVESIGKQAFYSCSSLKTIDIPESVTRIDAGAFWECSGIERIEIPEGVTSIEDYEFWGCSNLEKIILPESIESIGYGAFCRCANLAALEIPENVSKIGDYAFYGCDGLKVIYALCDSTAINQFSMSSDDVTVYYNPARSDWTDIIAEHAGYRWIKFAENDGVIVEYTEEDFEGIISLEVTEIDITSDKFAAVMDIFQNMELEWERQCLVYEIHVTDHDGNELHFDKELQVKLKETDDRKASYDNVYRITQEEELKDLFAVQAGGKLQFKTDTFGVMVISKKMLLKDTTLYGDLNGDGDINSADAVLMKKYLAGYREEAADERAYDVNYDGEITSADAVLLLKYLAGYDIKIGRNAK